MQIRPRNYASAATVSALALVLAGPAAADVTAEDVWAMLEGSFEVYGDGLTYDAPTMDGDTLTIANIRVDAVTDGMSFASDMGSLTFTENGDGTVTVGMADEITLILGPEEGANDGERMEILLRQPDQQIVASGTPEEMLFDVTAPTVELSLVEFVDGGNPVPAEASLTLNDISGSYTMREGDLREIDYDMAIGGMNVLIDVSEGDEVVFFLSGQAADLGMEMFLATPPGMDMMADPEEMADIFAQGFAMDLAYSIGQSAYMFEFNDGPDSGSGTVSAATSALDMSFDYDAVSYDAAITGLDLSILTPDLPFPIEASLSEYGIGLSMPLSATEEPAEWSVSADLVDLVISDMIWSMLDPSGQFARAPATLRLAMSGTATLFYDLLDPAQQEELAMAEMPGELNSASLDQLQLSVEGAELTGEGAFTFDNTDTTTFPGYPRPTGDLALRVSGAFALMESLVGMGLLPPDAVNQARMMSGMFARSTGEDQFETTVEVNEQGHLIVNGQRLQ
ncbi:DUF2125 domain-containing protein [Wenxinia saemankumensis]|uniref:DUF2125 domain-containing protein n=1 Tax=Wenxinia saemankumensis TaxID=1447782 RepID=A0A1M6E370_9RHOB|nr:DUF2125 domain-containing protein [Wenxinia saemankumensis]SHI79936.1 hypothetical protein SAMN05444417_1773 [Wenxinia saemankumensis]